MHVDYPIEGMTILDRLDELWRQVDATQFYFESLTLDAAEFDELMAEIDKLRQARLRAV